MGNEKSTVLSSWAALRMFVLHLMVGVNDLPSYAEVGQIVEVLD